MGGGGGGVWGGPRAVGTIRAVGKLKRHNLNTLQFCSDNRNVKQIQRNSKCRENNKTAVK